MASILYMFAGFCDLHSFTFI